MKQVTSFVQKNKKVIVYAIALMAILFALFGTPKGWTRALKYLDKYEFIEKEKIRKIEDSLTESREYHKLYIDSVENIETVVIPTFERQLNQSEYEKQKLREKLDSILFTYYSKRRLDSFADYAKYN